MTPRFLQTYETFKNDFFALFTEPRFPDGRDFLTYLNLPESDRHGDEASVVDTVIVAPLLGLLGFAEAERVYNEQKSVAHRPDFAPRDAVYGECFVVEDKATPISLTDNLENPKSTLSQLHGYARLLAVRFGFMTNGRQLLLYDFKRMSQPELVANLDILAATREWQSTKPPALSASHEHALQMLFDRCRKAHFTRLDRLEEDLAIDEEAWKQQALKLGRGNGAETVLVETVRLLINELQREGRMLLDRHLDRAATFDQQRRFFNDTDREPAQPQLLLLRERVQDFFVRNQAAFGLNEEELADIATALKTIEEDSAKYPGYQAITDALLHPLNTARQRQSANSSRSLPPFKNLENGLFVDLRDKLKAYVERVWQWHQRQISLRHTYRAALQVRDDYQTWTTLVQETMLGGLAEEQRRDEFALQAAYVIFIRLLLIRVCEDKGIFANRLLSDGGIALWQENIKRYFLFTNGETNTYGPLLEMAYENAQNIYAQFFTRRELFNWFQLNQRQLIMALHRLNRFDFAAVDSDIIGTIYNTYVGRKEKREKGQYYTPPEIVNYMLDTIGYTGTNIIGANKKLLDPACGSGSFLVTATRRLVDAYTSSGLAQEDPSAVLDRIHDNLYGFDLNPFACYLAEVNLLIQVLDLVKLAHDKGQRPQMKPFHIYNTDALERPRLVNYYARFNPVLAEEQQRVEAIKGGMPIPDNAQGFAFVVANPPYGATLSEDYKARLREDWADIFYGQPDTYTFFLRFGTTLLAPHGKLAFITPNTYLMGTNTNALRQTLLETGCIEHIVDLPQGIWEDANVDCVLFFLAAEPDAQKRRSHQVTVHILGLKDTLDRLVVREWMETLTHSQARWMDDLSHEMDIRYDDLRRNIETVCTKKVNGERKIVRLGDITESTQGIIPYETRAEGLANPYIKQQREIPPDPSWKPLLDGKSFLGRYELRWHHTHPHIQYGDWLMRPREERFFTEPKILVQAMRNRGLQRRLVATYDDQKFYNRHNFNNIIASDPDYSLKYILALFNSSLLNYYARRFDNVNINPSYFRQLPIFPATREQQDGIIALVDQILAKHAGLNAKRAQGYTIRRRRDGTIDIVVPYDVLLKQLQSKQSTFSTITLFDARAAGFVSVEQKTPDETHTGRAFLPTRYPTTVVVRHNRFWFTISDEYEQVRAYLLGSLNNPHWKGATWDDLKKNVLIPADADALSTFFQAEQQEQDTIITTLNEIVALDAQIDEQVLDLYGITDPNDRQRILESVPQTDDEAEEIPIDDATGDTC
jgi:type I restriction-modification system DNA methylase subunit